MAKRRIDPATRSLPVIAWPTVDQAAWRRAVTSSHILDEPGTLAHLRPMSRLKLERGYGQWLTWLNHRGLLNANDAPAERVSREHVEAYVGTLQARVSSRSVWGYLDCLQDVVQAMTSDRDWAWLRRLVARLQNRARPKKRVEDRLRSSGELYDAGFREMAAAFNRRPHLASDLHSWFRDGLVVALLAGRPIRMRNLAMIQIGTHLVKIDDVWWLRFTADETKTGRALEFPLPLRVSLAIDEYLTIHRPQLLYGVTSDALWISYQGRPLHSTTIHDRIKLVTKRWLRIAINPHNFRHAAATTIAERTPDEANTIRAILGHATLDSSIKNYNKAKGRQVARNFARMIVGLRHPRWHKDAKGHVAKQADDPT